MQLLQNRNTTLAAMLWCLRALPISTVFGGLSTTLDPKFLTSTAGSTQETRKNQLDMLARISRRCILYWDQCGTETPLQDFSGKEGTKQQA